MFCPSRSPLLPALLAIAAVACSARPAYAEKNWSIELESSVEATNNLEQRDDGNLDEAIRNALKLSYFPAADADNSALFQIEALNQRYRFNTDFDSTFFIATALASRRVYDSVFGYGGYQLLYKQADSPDAVSRADNDLFAGMVQYLPLSQSVLVFHGYQFDFLRAAVADTSYQGHSAYATVRYLTTDRWTNSFNARSQLRLFDTVGQLEWRNQLIVDSDYKVFDFWTVELEGLYVNSTSTLPHGSFGAWNIGLFSRFSI